MPHQVLLCVIHDKFKCGRFLPAVLMPRLHNVNVWVGVGVVHKACIGHTCTCVG
jgi:hypothetical protein